MENLPQARHFSKHSMCANSFSYHNHFTGREDFSPTFQMERMEARTSQSNLPNVPTWLSGGIQPGQHGSRVQAFTNTPPASPRLGTKQLLCFSLSLLLWHRAHVCGSGQRTVQEAGVSESPPCMLAVLEACTPPDLLLWMDSLTTQIPPRWEMVNPLWAHPSPRLVNQGRPSCLFRKAKHSLMENASPV